MGRSGRTMADLAAESDGENDNYDINAISDDNESFANESDESDTIHTDNDSEEEEEEEEEENNQHLEKLKRSLAHVSFEQLADIKSKMGMKEFNKSKNQSSISKEQILKDLKGATAKLKNSTPRTKQDMRRSDQHSPMEISSKKAVGRLRQVVPITKPKLRDPRFEKLSGHFNRDLFEKSYDFIQDYKKTEMEALRERLKKEKDVVKRKSLEETMTKMISREKSAENEKRKRDLLRERKKAEAELVKQGKSPYFLKRSEQRKLELIDKYKRLGDKNVDRILEKRRKRNAAKDHRHVPFKRRTTDANKQ